MTAPRDPTVESDGGSEYDYGKGIVNPSHLGQPDYGSRGNGHPLLPSEEENFNNAVADRRTDSTDPGSTRDFATAGNPDRYGPNPALIKEKPKMQPATPGPIIKKGVTRAE